MIISVITAVDPDRAEHLPEAWTSLRDQELPDDWGWEWLVQCDSTDPSAVKHVRALLPAADDKRVSFGSSRAGGPGIARNMALARSEGALIKTLDADDRLTPGVLARDIHACLQPGVRWSASRVLNDHGNGELIEHFEQNPSPGRVRSLSAYMAYTHENWRILVHPASLCINADALLALGGWMALPASEDTGLLLALDSVGDGWFHDEPGMLYRRWNPQMSAQPEHVDQAELDARRALIVARARAMGALIGD